MFYLFGGKFKQGTIEFTSFVHSSDNVYYIADNIQTAQQAFRLCRHHSHIYEWDGQSNQATLKVTSNDALCGRDLVQCPDVIDISHYVLLKLQQSVENNEFLS